MRKQYLVYAIYDKRAPDHILYIGRTCRDMWARLCAHKIQAKSSRPSLLSLYINDAGAKYMGIKMLEECADSREYEEKEKYWIRQYEPTFNAMQYSSYTP